MSNDWVTLPVSPIRSFKSPIASASVLAAGPALLIASTTAGKAAPATPNTAPHLPKPDSNCGNCWPSACVADVLELPGIRSRLAQFAAERVGCFLGFPGLSLKQAQIVTRGGRLPSVYGNP